MKRLGLLILPILFLATCKNEEEPIPGYLKIEPFTVDEMGGADWQKITDAWVYVNDQFIGGFSLPATVPVLNEGEVDILVFPGVKQNGISETPAIYSLLEEYKAKVTISPTETTTIAPSTRYKSEAKFPWSVDRASFNTTSIVLENMDGDTATSLQLTTDGAFDGRSVYLRVDTAHAVMEIATEVAEGVPNTGDRQVWLEMHYRNNTSFDLWILGTDANNADQMAVPVFQFLPSENWNKIYFNLTSFLVQLQREKQRLFFRVALGRDETGAFVQDEGEVFLDNIRLVHF